MLFQRPNYDWLIAGLGNPGAEYEKTRHNTGFMTLDLLAARLQVKVSKERFKALTAQADFGGQRLFLMKPLTYMNASGIAIEAAAHFYKIPPERVLGRRPQPPQVHHFLPGLRPVPAGQDWRRRQAAPGLRPGRLGALHRVEDRVARLSGRDGARGGGGAVHREKRL